MGTTEPTEGARCDECGQPGTGHGWCGHCGARFRPAPGLLRAVEAPPNNPEPGRAPAGTQPATRVLIAPPQPDPPPPADLEVLDVVQRRAPRPLSVLASVAAIAIAALVLTQVPLSRGEEQVTVGGTHGGLDGAGRTSDRSAELGGVQWTQEVAARPIATGHGADRVPQVVWTFGERLVAASSTDLYGLDADTGAVAWQLEGPYDGHRNDVLGVAYGGAPHALSPPERVVLYDGTELTELAPTTGLAVQVIPVGMGRPSWASTGKALVPVVDGVAVIEGRSRLAGVDLDSGEVLWELPGGQLVLRVDRTHWQAERHEPSGDDGEGYQPPVLLDVRDGTVTAPTDRGWWWAEAGLIVATDPEAREIRVLDPDGARRLTLPWPARDNHMEWHASLRSDVAADGTLRPRTVELHGWSEEREEGPLFFDLKDGSALGGAPEQTTGTPYPLPEGYIAVEYGTQTIVRMRAGKIAWRRPITQEWPQPIFASSDGVVYFSSMGPDGGGLVAIDDASGTRLWTQTDFILDPSADHDAQPLPVGDLVLAGTPDVGWKAVRLRGATVVENLRGRHDLALTPDGDLLDLARASGQLVRRRPTDNRDDLTVVWRSRKVDKGVRIVAVSESHAVLWAQAGSTGEFRSVDLADGTLGPRSSAEFEGSPGLAPERAVTLDGARFTTTFRGPTAARTVALDVALDGTVRVAWAIEGGGRLIATPGAIVRVGEAAVDRIADADGAALDSVAVNADVGARHPALLGTLLVHTTSSGLAAIDIRTGKQRWSTELATDGAVVATSVTLAGSDAYVALSDGRVVRLDARSGDVREEVATGRVDLTGRITVARDRILVPGAGGREVIVLGVASDDTGVDLG